MMKHQTMSKTSNVRYFKGIGIVVVLSVILYLNSTVPTSLSNLVSPGIKRSDPHKFVEDTPDDPLSDKVGIPTINPNFSHLHLGNSAMVASDVPICSKLGKEVLLSGGNAADAAVTVALCIGSINAHSSGIGGGGFILSRNNNDTISIDAREIAPKQATKEMYENDPLLSQVGGLAVGVPGELAGLHALFENHGSGNLTWGDLFEPVIDLNYKGWNTSLIFATNLQKEETAAFSKLPLIKEQWDFIYNKNGSLKKEGDFINRPNYAKTLQLIADSNSSDIFYDPNGEIAKSLVKSARNFGGIITEEDFGNYKPLIEKPINLNISLPNGKNLSVFTANGASSGLALIAGLNFFNKVYKNNDTDLLITHKIIESDKWLASVRTRLGDIPDRKQLLIDKYSKTDWIDEKLANGGYANNQTFDWKHYDPKFEVLENKGTSHFSIIDKDGNSVAMTTTVNLLFGSLVYDNSTGIILNNEMDDFSTTQVQNAFGLTPSIYNFIEPFKRPLSSTSPTIIIDELTGQPDLIIGAAGGSRIPTAILQAIIRLYYQDFTLLDAISYPRLHHQLIPEYLAVENITVFKQEHDTRFGVSIVDELEKLGHTIQESGTLTTMNGIKRNGYYLEGVSDWWRKQGEADGY